MNETYQVGDDDNKTLAVFGNVRRLRLPDFLDHCTSCQQRCIMFYLTQFPQLGTECSFHRLTACKCAVSTFGSLKTRRVVWYRIIAHNPFGAHLGLQVPTLSTLESQTQNSMITYVTYYV